MRRNKAARLTEAVAELFDIPGRSLPHGMDVEIQNDRDVFAEGCTGIAEYSRDRVVLEGGRMRAVILGDDFELFSFSDGRLCVRGRVRSVELERREGR